MLYRAREYKEIQAPNFLDKIFGLQFALQKIHLLRIIPQIECESGFLHDIKNYRFIEIYGLNHRKNRVLGQYWRWVLEDSVIESLRIITPELKDIRFTVTQTEVLIRTIPVVRLENAIERVPLKSFGEGMNRTSWNCLCSRKLSKWNSFD